MGIPAQGCWRLSLVKPFASGFVSSVHHKRLGDRAAIAALKIFDEAELTRPEW